MKKVHLKKLRAYSKRTLDKAQNVAHKLLKEQLRAKD